MNTTDLLKRIDGVRQTGPGRWIARCPGHEDRHPSLSVRTGDNGSILVHCFADCSVDAITSAVGLNVSDLFPERLSTKPTRSAARIPPIDALRCLSDEAVVVLLACYEAEPYLPQYRDRLMLAVQRILTALELCRHASR